MGGTGQDTGELQVVCQGKVNMEKREADRQ